MAKMHRPRIKLLATVPLLMVASVSVTRAQNVLSYGADAGVGETDNVTLVSSHKVAQTLSVADVDFDVQEQRRLFDVAAKGDFTDLDFLQGAYGNELIGRFDGLAHVVLVPEKLSWVLQDDFGQAQVDPFAPVTPDNRENINYASTGPDASFRLGAIGFMKLSARYARTQYQISPFDNNRFQETIAVGRYLSASSSISLEGMTERVLFSETAIDPLTNTATNTDFGRSSVYGHYDLKAARTDLTANLGLTRVDQTGDSFIGPSLKFQLSRVLSATGKLTLSAGRDITDASAGFSGLQPGSAGAVGGGVGTLGAGTLGAGAVGAAGPAGPAAAAGTSPATLSSTNYTITYGSLDWQYIRSRTTLDLNGQWEKDAYEDQPLSNLERETVQFRVDRQLTPAFNIEVHGSLYRTNYADVDYSETDSTIAGSLAFHEGHATEIRLRVEHTSRSVTGIGTGYTENRLMLTLGYKPKIQALPSRGPKQTIGAPSPPEIQ